MTITNDRLIGSDEILPVIQKLYRIGTWRGALNHIKKNGIPMTRTARGAREGKPMIIIRDLIEYELGRGRSITVNDILIK